MSMSRLSNRGANANQPAKLPGLQGLRVDDPQVQRAVEALREWVEVRLGSRGDKYEKAVTLREFEQETNPLKTKVEALGAFDGRIETLRSQEAETLPSAVVNGAFVALTDGRLFIGLNGRWRQITLVP
jgi:hypothetical protein